MNESAFPTNESNHEAKYASEGMTLRDYFAAKAMTTLVNFTNDKVYESEVAITAYRYADAMLKARGE